MFFLIVQFSESTTKEDFFRREGQSKKQKEQGNNGLAVSS